MNAITHLALWLKRFRYRCGYGVHSPYAFNFITGVVFERGVYYAYREMDALYGSGLLWRYSHQRTCLHFLFRLANFVRPDLFLKDSSVSTAEASYLSAGSRQSQWALRESLEQIQGQKKILMFVSADEVLLPELLRALKEKADPSSVLLLRTESAAVREHCSAIIQSSPYCGISFDLYDYLLVFFDSNLYKQHYLVNFFD